MIKIKKDVSQNGSKRVSIGWGIEINTKRSNRKKNSSNCGWLLSSSINDCKAFNSKKIFSKGE